MERGWARRVRREVKDWLKSIPGIGDEMAEYATARTAASRPSSRRACFSRLRFNYIAVNGHNIEELERHLKMAASIDDQPVLLHVLTRKGKDTRPPRPSLPSSTGSASSTSPQARRSPNQPERPRPTTDVFGETLCQLAKEDDRIVAVTAAMSSGTGTGHFKSRFPARFTDVASANSTPSPSRRASPRKATVLCGNLFHLHPARL